MLVPHHLNPQPVSGKGYPLSRVLVSIGNIKIKKKLFRAFSGNLSKTKDPNSPLSRKNGNTHAAPACIRLGVGGCLLQLALACWITDAVELIATEKSKKCVPCYTSISRCFSYINSTPSKRPTCESWMDPFMTTPATKLMLTSVKITK